MIWTDPNHIKQRCPHLVLKKEREGEYVLISDLQSGRAIQKEFRDKRDQLQLDKEFALTNIKLYSGLFTRFQTLLKNYSRKVADNVVTSSTNHYHTKNS